MSLQVSLALPLVAFVSYGTLLIIVFRQAAHKPVQRASMLYLFSAAIWSGGSFLWRLQASLFWNRVLVTGVAGTCIALFYFVLVFLEMKEQKRWLRLGYCLFVIVFIANLLGYVTRATYFVNGVAQFDIGPGAYLIGIYGYLYYGLSMYYLIRQYRRTRDRFYRNKVQYLIIGLGGILLAGSMNFVPQARPYPIDIAASVFNSFLIAYAILRHRLLDITIVIRKGLLYSIPTAIIGIGYFLVISLAVNLFHAVAQYQVLLLSLIVAGVTAIVAQPLRDKVQSWVDRLFFREKYDASLMLQRLSRVAASVLDLDKLMDMILDQVTTTMRIRGAAFLIQEESGGLLLIAQRGLDQNARLRLRKDHPIVEWLSRRESALSSRDIDVLPQFKSLWGTEREDLERIKAELFIPLKAKGELVGVLAVGPKLSEVTYGQDDQLTLITLANQTAVAIENARLYEAVSKSQREWEATFQAITDCICICDADLRILRANRALAQRLGTTPENLIGQRCDEVLRCSADSLQVTSDERSINAEREKHILGSTFQISSFPLRDDLGQVVGSVQMLKDVSERKALEEMWKRYEFIINTSKDLMALISPNYMYEAVNRAFCEAHRRELDQVVGRSVADIWGYERFMEQIKVPLDQCLAGNEVHYQLWFNFASLGRRCFDVSYYPYHGGGEAITRAVVISRDVTDRKQAEDALVEERALLAQRVEERTAELSAANVELARAARLKDEFLANMSHELRTPLTGILGLSEALQLQVYGPHNEKQLKALHSIEESGQHLLNLINDILDLSKIEAGKVELQIGPVAVEEVCQASLRMIKEAAQKKKLKVFFELDGMVVTVQADSRRLKQMLVNLLSNAVKFTPQGGSVGLEVAGDADQMVRLIVWDTGIGIAPEDMPRLFRPFVQLDGSLAREYAGTGLGLSLVQRMAEMHGGSVTVESEPGKGSRFTITLPWAGPAEETVPSSDVTEIPALQQTLSMKEFPAAADQPLILLAEDNEITLTTLTDLLRSRSFRVVIARNGKEAIERARETHPALIVMDIQMPGMDGLEATRRIRAETELAAIPIITLTALAMPGDRERSLAAGANDYMSKPLSLGRLVKAIENQLAQS
jgi:PAS domain S-box-containing protein